MLLPDHLLILEVMPLGPLLAMKQVAIQKSGPDRGWNLHYWWFYVASWSFVDIGSNAPRAAAYCEAGCNSEIWPRQGLKSSLQVVCALAHPWVATDIIVKIFDSSLFLPSGQSLRCQFVSSSRLSWQVWENPGLCLESGGLDIVSGYRWYQSIGCKSDLWPRQGPKSSIQVGLCITTFLSLQTVRLLLPYHLLISETCWL